MKAHDIYYKSLVFLRACHASRRLVRLLLLRLINNTATDHVA